MPAEDTLQIGATLTHAPIEVKNLSGRGRNRRPEAPRMLPFHKTVQSKIY